MQPTGTSSSSSEVHYVKQGSGVKVSKSISIRGSPVLVQFLSSARILFARQSFVYLPSNMAPSISERHEDINLNSTSTKSSHLQSSSTNPPEPTFRYTSTAKLQNAQNRVAHDFRSDVVTVPSEAMMQVRLCGRWAVIS